MRFLDTLETMDWDFKFSKKVWKSSTPIVLSKTPARQADGTSRNQIRPLPAVPPPLQ